jgi:hypothetical protein
MKRYELFCRKLVLERHYSASAFIASTSGDGLQGDYNCSAEDLSVERFGKALFAHASTFA